MKRRQRSASVLIVIAASAATVGFAAAQAVNLPTADPAVQGAIVGAIAGIAGGVIGAAIGVWGTRDVARQTLLDARLARRETRLDALEGRFLQERRASITEFVATVDDVTEQAWSLIGEPDAMANSTAMMLRINRAYRGVVLMAPDLLDPAERLANAADTFHRACARQGASGWKPGDGQPLPEPNLDELRAKRLDVANLSGDFVGAAMVHLGTHHFVARSKRELDHD